MRGGQSPRLLTSRRRTGELMDSPLWQKSCMDAEAVSMSRPSPRHMMHVYSVTSLLTCLVDVAHHVLPPIVEVHLQRGVSAPRCGTALL
jgi:hypothetical protein